MDDIIKRYLALIYVVIAIVALVCLVWWPGENGNIAMLVVGVLTTNITTIINFFFGSSEGSQKKTAIIQGLTECKEVGK